MRGGCIADRSRRIGSVLVFAAALLSKESALVLLAVLIVEDAARAHTARAVVLRWRRYLPYLIVTIAFLVFRASVVGSIGLPERPRLVDNPLATVSAMSRGLTAIALIARYVGLVLVPVHLSPDYTYNQIPALSDPFDVWFVCGLTLVLGSIILLRRRWTRSDGFGIVIFLVALLPLTNLAFPVGTNFAERLLYLPMVGICTVAGSAYDPLRRRLAGICPAWLVVLVVSVALGARTAVRNTEWRDDLTLFTAASVTSPGSAKVHLNLGNVLSDSGDKVAAMGAYERALSIHPGYVDAHYNRGVLLQDMGHLAKARRAFDVVLQLDEAHVSALVNRGIVAARIGDSRSAIRDLSLAVETDPDRVEAWYNYGVAQNRAGLAHEAEASLGRALTLDPSHEDAAIELAGLYRATGETDSLLVTYRRLLARNRMAYQAAFNLGVELERMGRIIEAIQAFELGARDRSERGAMARYRTARLFDRAGRREDARRAYTDFLERWTKEDGYRRSARRAVGRQARP